MTPDTTLPVHHVDFLKGPSFCWLCTRRLMIATVGENAGHYVWHIVRDPDGHEHRVHKQCAEREKAHVLRVEAEPLDATRRKLRVWT